MTDERRDDEIIGRALSRAIETIDVNQTPFERSRIAMAPGRRSIFGVWQMATAAAVVVLALAIGSWLTRPTESGPVAGSPTPTIAPATQPGATQPTATPSPGATAATVATRVFFVRDQLPPVSASVPGNGAHIPVDSIVDRIAAAHAAPASSVPAGAVNPLALVGLRTDGTSVSAKMNGDTASVEFDLPSGWGVRGSAQTQALVQQLVYTITEEPGIRRALITEKGKANAVIDQLVVDKPLSREDVFGYGLVGSRDSIEGGEGNDGQVPALTTQWSVDSVAPGLARFVIQVAAAPGATAALPLFRVDVTANDEANKPEGGKWRYSVTVTNGADPTTHAIVDRSPLRAVGAYPGKGDGKSTIYELGLDDLRPWRVFTLSNPTRIVLDIGGTPQSVSDRVAVYQPRPGATVTRDLQLTGAGRTFEANTNWRVLDSTGREVASGTFMGGSGPLWGAFDTRIAIPASVSGNVTLEVFEASAKDGSPQGVVQIPLTVR
jgi:hypothetical protein